MPQDFSRHGYLWTPTRRCLLHSVGVLAAGLLVPRVARAAYSMGAHAILPITTNGGTTAAIDTTGCNLLVVAVGVDADVAGLVSDAKGNSWTPLTRNFQTSSIGVQLYYCAAPTVGSGHTFAVSSSGHSIGACVTAFRGAAAPTFRSQVATDVGSQANATTAINSPSGVVSTDLVVSAVAWPKSSITSVSATGLTVSDAAYNGQWGHGFAMGYSLSGFTSAAWNVLVGFAGYETYLGPIATVAFSASGSGSRRRFVVTGGGD